MREDNSYCKRLVDLSVPEEGGGKAENLRRILALGLSIPTSLVVTPAALGFFLNENELYETVSHYLASFSNQTRSESWARYEHVLAEVTISSLPVKLISEFDTLLLPLFSSSIHGLAVRSSAVSEDSSQASFAGVFQSYLCIRTMKEFEAALKQCWLSCWSPGALAYAGRMGVTIEPDSMAVLVQEVINPDCSGVMFTADPLTGDPQQCLVNATYGFLQDAITGTADADRYRLAFEDGELLEQQVAEKSNCLVPGDGKLDQQDVTADRVTRAALGIAELASIWSAGREIDRVFSTPVDIEWVLSEDKLTIVQVRPITALPQFFPHQMSEQDADQTWYLSSPYWYIPAEVGGRVVAPLFQHIWDAQMWQRAVPDGLPLLSRNAREMDVNGHRFETGGWAGISGDWLNILESMGKETEIDTICDTVEAGLNRTEENLRSIWLEGKKAAQDFLNASREAILHSKTSRELVPLFLEVSSFDSRGNFMGYGAPQSLGWLCERVLMRFVDKHVPGFPVDRLLRGLPSHSYARLAAAQALGRNIIEKSVLDALEYQPVKNVIPYLIELGDTAFLADFETYCWDFGQRPPSWLDRSAMWTTDTVAWADFSTDVLLTIKKTLRGESRDLNELLARNNRIREEAEQLILQRFPQAHLDRFTKLLEWARFWLPILDDRLLVGGWDHLARHELLWHISARLVSEGLIDHPQDVYLLDRESLEQFLVGADKDLRSAFESNRRQYEINCRLTPPAYLGKPPADSDDAPVKPPDEIGTVKSATTAVLKGRGISPGEVVGTARVANGLSDDFLDTLTDQDILVCHRDVPFRVDWLGLFLVVKGLVAATGCGAGLHHAAQIARECGIVYVELADELTGQITDESTIELDAGKGEVRIL